MVFIDQTDDFRALISKGSALPSSSATSSRPHSRAQHRRPDPEDDGFLKEAYQIYGHLSDLGRMLKTVRKAYLSSEQPPPMSRRPRTGSKGGDDDQLKRLEGSKYLSERERDEIEVRAKMVLRRCRERVTTLEQAEQSRQAKVIAPKSAFTNFLNSLAPVAEDPSEPLLAAHRQSVIWTLTSKLAKLSSMQTDLQEERAKRRQERSRTLGGGAAREAAQLQIMSESRAVPRPSQIMPVNPAALTIVPTDEPPIEEQLSPEQLQQFESENSALLEHMESKLSSVLAAEKSLLEISAMQTELVRHLVQQTEITDRLYDEAVGSVAEMGKANQQLKKAKERGGEARLFLIVFLVGASLALLFLDWYA